VGDTAAEAAGVVRGMRLSGAWALLPDLHVQARDPLRESIARQRLACRLGEFASDLCLHGEQALLLDIAPSLRLFGGHQALCEQIVTAAAGQGFSVYSGLAPTPLAALWLAQAAPGTICLALESLPDALAALPVEILTLPAREQARLTAFGARVLADVLCLPRAALARRLGSDVAAQLARALGEVPDPRPRFAFPETFTQRLELPGRAEHAEALGFAGRRLLDALAGWLTVRQAGIQSCTLRLEHEGGASPRPPTLLTLGFSSPTRDRERLHRVLSERLPGLNLPAPVEALQLNADTPLPLAGESAPLFGVGSAGASPAASENAIAALVERLRARLGETAVHGLRIRAEHRPELASQASPMPVAPPSTQSGPPRPLWLLAQPAALAERDGRPQRHGPLELLAGPERIESGWWDADEPGALGDVRRDYFIARNRQGGWLWIFRDAEGWFLHGVFA